MRVGPAPVHPALTTAPSLTLSLFVRLHLLDGLLPSLDKHLVSCCLQVNLKIFFRCQHYTTAVTSVGP